LTLASPPDAIENGARPSVTDRAPPEGCRRRAVSFVRPEQRPTVPAGQPSLSATNLPPKDSRVDTSATPAKSVVEVLIIEVAADCGDDAV
jgi:hypothetical protein